MAARTWNAINLCDGYGGFSLALAELGVRTVARVERDSYAAAVLVERMGQARLDSCPVWDDLESFDGAAWRGCVHIVTAGFPCQPFSAAGSRSGVDDERWLWPWIERIVRDVEPGYVILENVPGVVRAGLAEVLAGLADLGFDAEWGLYSAAAVGAPHRRERFWLVAHASGSGFPRWDAIAERIDGVSTEGRRADVAHADRDGQQEVGRGDDLGCDVDGCDGPHVGHACSAGRPEVTGRSPVDERPDGWRTNRDHVADRPNEDVVDAECSRLQRFAERQIGLRLTTETGGWPPLRDDPDGWRQWIAAGGPQPVLRRLTDGPPDGLADALHLGGNGLVPQAAREAIRQLLNRIHHVAA